MIDDDNDIKDDNDDPAEHPDLTKLKEWFLLMNAMQNLRNYFLFFLSPVKVVTIDQAIEHAFPGLISSPDSDGEVGFMKNAMVAKTVKTVQGTKMLAMLSFFQKTLIVWNYINAKQALEPGLVRLNWMCVSAAYFILPSLSISGCL